MCASVCVCVCVRACVRTSMRACVRACVCVCVCIIIIIIIIMLLLTLMMMMMMMMVTMMMTIFAACPAGQTQCSTEAYCLDDARFCDRVVDCWEAADEISCSESFISFVFPGSLLPQFSFFLCSRACIFLFFFLLSFLSLCFVRSQSSCVLQHVFSSSFLCLLSFCYVRSPLFVLLEPVFLFLLLSCLFVT